MGSLKISTDPRCILCTDSNKNKKAATLGLNVPWISQRRAHKLIAKKLSTHCQLAKVHNCDWLTKVKQIYEHGMAKVSPCSSWDTGRVGPFVYKCNSQAE